MADIPWVSAGKTDRDGQPKEKSQLALYGAGMVAVSVYYAIKTLYPDCKIISFIVSEITGNPAEIDHVPVLSLDEFCRIHLAENVKLLVATPENHHSVIAAELKKQNLEAYFYMDSEKEARLMQNYYKAVGQFSSLRSYDVRKKVGRDISLRVGMARFHKDSSLKNPYKLLQWVFPIQAGAALTDISIAHIKDNIGENISEKNVNYSELTVLYWLWKSCSREDMGGDYIGLFHYRRILDVTEEDLERMGEHDVDVVLPYPTIHYPSADEHHRRYVKEGDWKAMALAVRELTPEYEKAMADIFSQPYFYNYNMLIAKRHVFHDFCSWMFPILNRTEDLTSQKGWERADRYIGYLGENLTTLYFMYHKDNLKIAHAGRLMLI